MNSKMLGSTVMAICLAMSSSVFAQNHDRRDDNGAHKGPPGHSFNQSRAHDDHHAPNNNHYRGRGAGPNHNFYKGGRIPTQYRSERYIVHDWRGHHLSEPPRGYYWVQTGSDFVLVAIATGIITQILLGNAAR